MIWFIAYLLYNSRDKPSGESSSAVQSGKMIQRGASGTAWQVSTGPDGTRVETLSGEHVLTFEEISRQLSARGDASQHDFETAILDFKVRGDA